MSCGCGVLKKNANESGVFGTTILALKKKKENKKILLETAVFGLSGVFYDWMLYSMIYDENEKMRSGMEMDKWTPKMIKSVYQMLVLGGLHMMGKKLKPAEVMKSALAVWIANYGVDMLDGMEYK
jgi:hypothetical protein